MKKIGILIENMFDEQELIYPYHRLRENYKVHLIGSECDKVYRSKVGFGMKSTHASKDVKARDYAGIYIPGGFSPDYMRRTKATIDFIKAVYKAGKPIAAICHGPWALISALDLKGKYMTSYPSIRVDVENAGATWMDEEVIIDSNLITSRSPLDLPAQLKKFTEIIG